MRGVPANPASSGSVEATAISIAGGGAAPARGGGFIGATNLVLRAGCLARHARLSPFLGGGAGHTGPVGIGKDGGHGGWLVGGGEGIADYRGTKTKKEKVKIFPVDGADT